MLPVHRLIGHKEYGNRPPGGYPGRKSDPRYDMDWRRGRVAAFHPRNEPDPDLPLDLEDDDMPLLVNIVTDDKTRGLGTWQLDGIGYHNTASSEVAAALRKVGCKQITITDSVHRKWAADQDRLRGVAPTGS